MAMKIEGYEFEGPFKLDVDELSSKPGIVLICTEAGEGVKILCIEQTSNMNKHVTTSPRKEIWKKNAYKSMVDVYTLEYVKSEADREKLVDKLVYKRKAHLKCQVEKIIEDDW